MSLTNPLCGIMDANNLTGLNFTNWPRNLKILLKSECIAYVLKGDGLIESASYAFEYEV